MRALIDNIHDTAVIYIRLFILQRYNLFLRRKNILQHGNLQMDADKFKRMLFEKNASFNTYCSHSLILVVHPAYLTDSL